MSVDKKKLAAITTAVFTYIKMQEETAVGSTGVAYPANTTLQPCLSNLGNNPNYVSIWGLAGRNAQMNIRSMMQMRTFK